MKQSQVVLLLATPHHPLHSLVSYVSYCINHCHQRYSTFPLGAAPYKQCYFGPYCTLPISTVVLNQSVQCSTVQVIYINTTILYVPCSLVLLSSSAREQHQTVHFGIRKIAVLTLVHHIAACRSTKQFILTSARSQCKRYTLVFHVAACSSTKQFLLKSARSQCKRFTMQFSTSPHAAALCLCNSVWPETERVSGEQRPSATYIEQAGLVDYNVLWRYIVHTPASHPFIVIRTLITSQYFIHNAFFQLLYE